MLLFVYILTYFKYLAMVKKFETQGIQQRIKTCIAFLKDNGVIHTQQNIVDMMQRNKSSVSRALNGDPLYLTNDFIESFANTFQVNKNWLETGEGEMLLNSNTCLDIKTNENQVNSYLVERFIKLLEKKDEQMDRLIGIIEKSTNK